MSTGPDPERFFRTEHLKADLKGRSVRGGAVTIAAQAGKFILNMGSTVVLARLLTPEDYGLIGMVTVILRFVQLFKDLGLSKATVQSAEINHKQVSTLFWINVAVSCLIGLVVAVLAPAVAWFYSEPRLTWITLALASSFIFGGLGVQHQALLLRQMRFTSLAQIDIFSMVAGVVSAIIFAWYGAGYWALVFSQIVTAIVDALGSWVMCGWRPGLPSRRSGVGPMLAFGRNLTGFNCLNYFSRNLDNIVIGRYWGPIQLGLYAKAYQLVLLPIQQINGPVTSVALPALSRLQNEPERYRAFYYKAILVITALGMPVVAFLFATADQIILILLGKQWLGLVPIFQFLMPDAFLGTFNVATGWVYQSLGRTDRQLRVGIVMSIINSLIFLTSVHWGVIVLAAAYGLSRPLFIVPVLLYCYEGTPLRLTELANTLYRPAIASIGAAAVIMGINQLLPASLNVFLSLLIDGAIYGLLYLAIWLVLPDGRRTLVDLFEMIKLLKKKQKT